MSIDESIDYHNFSTYLYLKDRKLYRILQAIAGGFNYRDLASMTGRTPQNIHASVIRIKKLYKHFESKTLINTRL